MTVSSCLLCVAIAFQAPVRDTPTRLGIGTASIGGVVVSADTPPALLRRAMVTVAGTDLPFSLQVVTDDAGRFMVAGLPGGRFTVTAEKAGYVKTYYGGKRPGRPPATPLALAEGQPLRDLHVVLLRGAVIAGVVSDETGRPLAGAQVQSWQPVAIDGVRKLAGINGALMWATTDELGRYRLYGLPPGEYAVSAGGSYTPGEVRETTERDIQAATQELSRTPAATAVPVPADNQPLPAQVTRLTRYHPDRPDAATAEVFTLATGEEREGVNITVPLVRAASVEGIALGPNGQPPVRPVISVVNAGDGTLWSSPGVVQVGPDGRFRLRAIPPGRYALAGRALEEAVLPVVAGVASSTLWAETEFTVSGDDVSGVVLQFVPGRSLNGRVVFQGERSPAGATSFRVSLRSVTAVAGSANAPGATPAADGTFVVRGVAPGTYRLDVVPRVPAGWTLRSVQLNGVDVRDSAFDLSGGTEAGTLTITLSDRVTSISGTVFDSLGRPTPEYSVLAFSTDRAHWTAPLRVSPVERLGSDGRFNIEGLPPGEYYVSVVTDIDPREATSPSVLETLIPAAIRITLGEGEKKTQDLRLGQ